MAKNKKTSQEEIVWLNEEYEQAFERLKQELYSGSRRFNLYERMNMILRRMKGDDIRSKLYAEHDLLQTILLVLEKNAWDGLGDEGLIQDFLDMRKHLQISDTLYRDPMNLEPTKRLQDRKYLYLTQVNVPVEQGFSIIDVPTYIPTDKGILLINLAPIHFHVDNEPNLYWYKNNTLKK